MNLDFPDIVAEMACNLGREFPAPPQEMVLRQLAHLMEEVVELDEALEDGSLEWIADELPDAFLTPYMVAHYMGDIGLTLDTAVLSTACCYVPESPYRPAGRAMKAGRRYLGIARRRGPAAPVILRLSEVLVSVRAETRRLDLDLDRIIETKLDIIFTRGWREPEPTG